ncbi:RluA family pseudouridine synthase [Streptococcus zhangguiae]|uniref:Pseudouridine synthase n=1 Tax=Streptococcus zhangguiae TaxID=2664091 RepID=A0A6I4R7E8_9STRE|nr:RluA family pseudouridine synthase [Streptococcus sp. zg-70]MWV55429.1 RluA family pseudouridine synthase [Streptococcus sp. zg-70]
MKYTITIPEQFPAMSVKELLEDYFLIPRKIRHFLRTKKHVLVNQQIVHWQSEIQAGDLIELIFDKEDYPEKVIPWGTSELVEVLYEDEHLIVVNKPEGMKTHGNDPTEIALLNHVSAYVQQTCYVVHRLDKETSGAILFAKNPFILPILNRLLEDKAIYRDYLALCQGHLLKKTWTMTDKIGRHRHDRRKRIVDPKHGQVAKTRITLVREMGNYSLVNCQLETGRTHQIRVHLSHHGHAIVGDPLYSHIVADRLMLHAHKLTFTHPFTLETISVHALSDSFEQTL